MPPPSPPTHPLTPLSAKGDWTPDMLKLPDHLVVIARHPGGQPLSTGEIRAAGDPGTPYTGKLSIPETGDVQIVVAIPRDDGSNVELADSAIERTVIQGGRPSASPAEAGAATTSPSASTPEPAASSSGGIPPFVWIAGIGVLVVVGVVVGRRVLSDL